MESDKEYIKFIEAEANDLKLENEYLKNVITYLNEDILSKNQRINALRKLINEIGGPR